jgi:hypothetical protein
MSTITIHRYSGGAFQRALQAHIDDIKTKAYNFFDKVGVTLPSVNHRYVSYAKWGYVAIMLGVITNNLTTSEGAAAAAVAPVEQTTATPTVSKVDDRYPYPHIRIAEGVPESRSIDYSSSPFIEQASVGTFARYLTIPVYGQKVGDGDYIRSLDEMYRRKFSKYPKSSDAARLEAAGYSTYNSSRVYMTLGQYVRGFDQVIDEANAGMDWRGLCKDKWISLKAKKCDAFIEIAKRVDAKVMVSYQLTETGDKMLSGEANAWVVDQVYRYLGREAFDVRPSEYDGEDSAGAFQLVGNKLIGFDGSQPRAITAVSRYGGVTVPETFSDFKRTDHERGAYYFALYNLAKLVKALDEDRIQVLQEAMESRKEDVVSFLASSHHGQENARSFAIAWVNDGLINPISVYMHPVKGRDYPKYATSARENYRGLVKYVNENFYTW